MNKAWFLLASLSFLSLVAMGQTGNLTIKIDKDTLFTDEVIKIEFELNNLSGQFIAPDFSGWKLISGPNISSSFIMVNGEVTQKKTYSYVIMPEKAGTIIIGSASIVSDTQEISSDPIFCTIQENSIGKNNSNTQPKIFQYSTNGSTAPTIKPKRVLKKF